MNKPFQDIFTPDILIDELLDSIPQKKGMKILEPSAGNGNMVLKLHQKFENSEITAIEIQQNHIDVMIQRFQVGGIGIKQKITPISVFNECF